MNAILDPSLRICSVEFCNPILEKETDDDKLSLLDILAEDGRGRLIKIEIQSTVLTGLNQRLTYYVWSLYSGELREGGEVHGLEFGDQSLRTDRTDVLERSPVAFRFSVSRNIQMAADGRFANSSFAVVKIERTSTQDVEGHFGREMGRFSVQRQTQCASVIIEFSVFRIWKFLLFRFARFVLYVVHPLRLF